MASIGLRNLSPSQLQDGQGVALTQHLMNGASLVVGCATGLAKIAVSLVVFRLFNQSPGMAMVALFIAFSLIPPPEEVPALKRKNLRYADCGNILGLLVGWLWLYP